MHLGSPCQDRRQGTVLLFTLILSAFLSGLLLLATTARIFDAKGSRFLEESIRLLYLADSGLAHGQAYCMTRGADALDPEGGETGDGEAAGDQGEGEGGAGGAGEIAYEDRPFGRWISFGGGQYRLEAFDLTRQSSPYLARDSGVLLVCTSSVAGMPGRKLCLLLDGPPAWKRLAWWEPE
ncbi:MAG: hypothetical protein AB1640_16350 [bacterium]